MEQLYIASGNLDKTHEIERILSEHEIPMKVSAASALGGMPFVEEAGVTYAENARLKAEALRALGPKDAYYLGDDSGVEVDALNGAPGLYSARYAGPEANYRDNNKKMLEALKGVPEAERTARYICVLLLLMPSGEEVIFEGTCTGKMHHESLGTEGFGYDPIFILDGYDKTYAELGLEIKNKTCHRFNALKKLVTYLSSAVVE